jgi:hypothetical protein
VVVVIEPIDEEERAELLQELLAERFGAAPNWGEADTPQAVARRRRVLCSVDDADEAA